MKRSDVNSPKDLALMTKDERLARLEESIKQLVASQAIEGYIMTEAEVEAARTSYIRKHGLG